MDDRKRAKAVKDVVEHLAKTLDKGYHCCPDPQLPIDDIIVDVVVDYDSKAMIAIGVYTEQERYEQDLCFLINTLGRTRISVGFLFDEHLNFKLIDKDRLYDKVVFNSHFDEIVSEIRKEKEKITIKPNSQKVKQRILQILDDTPDFDTKEDCRVLLESCCDNLDFSLGQISLFKKDENEFMLTLLGKINCEYLWRYTSLSSLFETIKNGKQTMFCPISMNDASEGLYADSQMPWFKYYIKDETYYDRKNGIFMLSCCDCREEDEDNLSMWRLYGDNSEGVCIKYTVDYEKIDYENMYIAPVNYAREIGDHPELDFLARLQNTIIENNWFFVLRSWHLWKYFFKPFEYSIENEVRLVLDYYHIDEEVYEPEIVWFLDKSNHIINRLATLPITEFPLKICKVIVGSNMPNADVNIEQIEFMLYQQVSYIDNTNQLVTKSRIKSYRK